MFKIRVRAEIQLLKIHDMHVIIFDGDFWKK